MTKFAIRITKRDISLWQQTSCDLLKISCLCRVTNTFVYFRYAVNHNSFYLFCRDFKPKGISQRGRITYYLLKDNPPEPSEMCFSFFRLFMCGKCSIFATKLGGKSGGSAHGVPLFEFEAPCKVMCHACVFISACDVFFPRPY